MSLRHRGKRVATQVFAAAFAFAVGTLAVALGGCRPAGGPLGQADSYMVYEPITSSSPGVAPAFPEFRELRLDDARAAPIHRGAADGFLGELLRTDYLAKQLVRDGWKGKHFSAAARASAAEPTVLLLAGSRMARPEQAKLGLGFATAGSFGRHDQYGNVMWIETGDDPVADPAFVQTASGRVARLVAERLAGAAGTLEAARPLIDGYALAMEVIGREWRVGEGPQGVLAPSAGTGTQRERFAGVRGNAFVLTATEAAGQVADATLRPAAEMVTDPGVVAAVLHRMAQATGVGRRVAPAEIYAPFVGERVPPGVSPAAVLGPIRNFQVKLLCAWAAAILAGAPPRDLIDLVTAYAEALPAERAAVYRIFVVTTYGATVKPGGVSPKPGNATSALAELTALSAEVTAGRRSLRAALPPRLAPAVAPAAPPLAPPPAPPAPAVSAPGAARNTK